MTTTKIILIVVFTVTLILIWWRLFGPKKKAKEIPFPLSWRNFLLEKVGYYQRLSASEKVRFESEISGFIAETKITGVEVEVNDEDRLLVAASAVIPIFGFRNWRKYPNLKEVLLYPDRFHQDNYSTEGEDRHVLGMVGWGVMNNQMVLSKPALHSSFAKGSSTNVGIHEFAHLLDKMDGATDGLPEYFLDRAYSVPWLSLIHGEMKRIARGKSDIRPYGATSEVEFFAVAAEYFFERPAKLRKEHPELFQMMEQIFQQDMNNDDLIGDVQIDAGK